MDIFINQLDKYQRQAQLSEYTIGITATNLLRGAAQQLVNSLTDEDRSWSDIKQILRGSHRKLNTQNKLKEQLTTLTCRSKISSYIHRFTELTNRIENLYETDNKFHFEKGLPAEEKFEVIKMGDLP